MKIIEETINTSITSKIVWIQRRQWKENEQEIIFKDKRKENKIREGKVK